MLASEYIDKVHYKSALVLLEKALNIHPNLFQPAFNHTFVLRRLNRYNEAQSEFNILIQKCPYDAKLYQSRCNTLLSLNRIEEAKLDMEFMFHMAPNDINTQKQQAFYFYTLNDFVLCKQTGDEAQDRYCLNKANEHGCKVPEALN